MKTERVELFSEGARLVGLLRLPDGAGDQSLPVIVQPPGYLGLAAGPVSEMYHEKFTEGGYAVLSVDYRGFGESEGEAGWIHPGRQLEDLLNVVSYASANNRFDLGRIFTYGHGGTGGGNAIVLGATDDRIRAVGAQTAVADGRNWLRSMRTESEWQAYLTRLTLNEQRRATDGQGEIVDPRQDIMVATPERKVESTRAYADKRVGAEFHLASATHIMRYRPIEYVARIAPRPLLLISLEGDVVTPPDLGTDPLYAAAGTPKRLIRQRGVSHYDAYRANLDTITAEILRFFDDIEAVPQISLEEIR
jgi:acetyl esterase/lipase